MEYYIFNGEIANNFDSSWQSKVAERKRKYEYKVINNDRVDLDQITQTFRGRELLTELRIYAPSQEAGEELAKSISGFKRVITRINPELGSIWVAAKVSSLYKFKLRYLTCFSTEDYSGPDEALLIIKYRSSIGNLEEESRGPYSLNDNKTKWIEEIFEYQEAEGIEITLYDEDSPDADDWIDSHKWHSIDGIFREKRYEGDGAEYQIGYFGA